MNHKKKFEFCSDFQIRIKIKNNLYENNIFVPILNKAKIKNSHESTTNRVTTPIVNCILVVK